MSSNHSDDDPFLYLCLGIVLGVVAFFRGFNVRAKKKLIENIPTSTVRGMAVGLAEIHGMARPCGETIKAPFSKTESVFFHYKIEEHRGSGKSSHWVTIKEFASPQYFFLEDSTGKALIDPAGAELFLAADREYQLGFTGGDNARAFEDGLIDIGIDPHGFLGLHKELRCSETFICPGDPIYALGTAAINVSSDGSQTGCENLCIQKGPGIFFCLSDKSEKELLASMGWKMYLYLYGGPVLTVTCLFFLIRLYFSNFF